MSPHKWTIKDLLEVTTDYLRNKNIDQPRLSADILLAHVLKVDRVKLYIDFDQPVNERELNRYRALIRRRVNREPIQYITGVQEFWSIEFSVTPKVLIPRAESEVLVEQVISLVKNKKVTQIKQPRILDLGTGSGAIAVSIAKELKEASVWASDISHDALDMAKSNAKKSCVEDKITFIQGNLWQPFRDQSVLFDIIVSNPPYIPSEDFDSLAPEVRDYEPRQALDGQEEGMFYIRRIILEGSKYLQGGGWLLVEMDPGQIEKASALAKKENQFLGIHCVKDYSNHYRVLMAQKIINE